MNEMSMLNTNTIVDDPTSVTYLKARHLSATIYIECSENDIGELIRAKLAHFFQKEFRIFYKGVMLDDQANLYNQSVHNGGEVFITTKKEYEGTWETLEDVGYVDAKQ